VGYKGTHYLGGRFLPPKLASSLGIKIPNYGAGAAQVVRLVEMVASLREERIVEVHVTAASTEEANKIAAGLLEANLVACVNIVPAVTSVYRWKDKIETSSEVLMVMKVDFLQ
jgi:cephalosporin-C deacetylase-like acetyl esterase